MQVIIDRFEEGYAVVELPDRRTINVPSELFPGSKEGDIIDIAINKQNTTDKKISVKEKFENLRKR